MLKSLWSNLSLRHAVKVSMASKYILFNVLWHRSESNDHHCCSQTLIRPFFWRGRVGSFTPTLITWVPYPRRAKMNHRFWKTLKLSASFGKCFVPWQQKTPPSKVWHSSCRCGAKAIHQVQPQSKSQILPYVCQHLGYAPSYQCRCNFRAPTPTDFGDLSSFSEYCLASCL